MTSTPCITCGRPTPAGTGRCPAHRNPARRIRSAQPWRQLAELVRAQGRCARCLTTTGPFEANHVTPLGSDPGSVAAECLCVPCHRAVTRLQRGPLTV